MAYTLFTTVNRANGTDYDMATRECATESEVAHIIEASIVAANQDCTEQSTFPASSIVFTVVGH